MNDVYILRGRVRVATSTSETEKAKILLGLLQSVDRDGGRSQRNLASELGIALGLVNAYLKRCIKKGLVKVAEVPRRRYAYFLTPQGFAEKSRLTIEYLTSSFDFFRQARADCARTLASAQDCGWNRIALAGISDLAEIAVICAFERKIEIVAVIDASSSLSAFMGAPVVCSVAEVAGSVDAVMVTDLHNATATFLKAAMELGRERVLAPTLLGIPAQAMHEAAL